MYRIINNQTPSYLKEIIEPHLHDQTLDRYPLRTVRIFDPPLCRTVCFYNSFFPSMFNEFNSIAPDLLNIRSIQQFKKLISPAVNINERVTDIFKFTGRRDVNIILCQLRNCCSNLNFDLYNDHLADSALCTCGFGVETASHFFFECSNFTDIRVTLYQNITHEIHNHQLIDVVLNGCEHCNEHGNRNLLLAVSNFIIGSKRFNI